MLFAVFILLDIQVLEGSSSIEMQQLFDCYDLHL